ncbi:ABC transporter permease [Nocardia cerradoensis]|uniref:ABC transporter permease n=1 Tax=Nocardia cerradoensis TaxID=85688 RepID=UPI0002FAE094|nr:ABC transporter permease [Nocardia cerradoensis]NKY45767.1 ABC transporter permease [Nocardia cerradoensis]
MTDTEIVVPLAPVRRPARQDLSLIAAFAIFAVVLLWALVPGLFTSHNPVVGVPADAFSPPSAAHWFGTDRIGRDSYTRLVHGTRATLVGAFAAVLLGLVAGSVLGVVAAVVRGPVEAIIMRLVDVLFAVPGFLLALVLVAALGPGTLHIALGVGIAAIAPFARLVRAEALRITQLEYVQAARLSGTREPGVLVRHVLPNSIGPVLALVAVELGSTILAIAALGFLGFGAPPPAPEWGTLLSEGRNYLGNAWWLTTFPGLAVMAVVLAFARLSHWIRSATRL